MKYLVGTVAYILLALCVLAGAGIPGSSYALPVLWMNLALVAVVGIVAGGIAPRILSAWLAWLALIVIMLAGFGVLAIDTPASIMLRISIYPLAASVGVATGLAARRMPIRHHRWRFAPIALCVAATVGLFFLAGPLARWSTSVQRPAPAYTLQLLNGSHIGSSKLSGKTVVLVFWAT